VSAPPLRLGGARRERVAVWALLAVLLAVLGVVASIWRPVAPAVGAVDTELATFDAAVMTAVDAYRGPRYLVSVTATALGVLVPLLLVLTRRGRRLISRAAGTAGQGNALRAPSAAGTAGHAPLRGALVAVTVAALSSLATLPLAAWLRIVHDGRWEFRTQPWHGWAVDWLTVSAGTWATMGVLAVVLLAAVRRWPRSWPYRLTVGGSLLAAAVVTLHPLLLQPVLLPTEPLPEGDVRDTAEEILAETGATELPLYVGDASARTTRANAMVAGLGPTERVVLYDTLLELPEDQVRSVLAHELAHREHRDLLRGVLAAPTALLVGLVLLRAVAWSSASRRLVHARGPTDPRLIAVVLAAGLVLELAGTPVANLLSRRAEIAADHRALEITGEAGLQIAAARAFTVRDLSAPRPPTWVQVLYGTHPSIEERIRSTVAWSESRELPELEELEEHEREIAHPSVREGPP
jgi:STE24 endopeptidase